MPRFIPEAIDVNLAVLAVIDDIAAELAATPAQIALARLRYRGRDFGAETVPIPGTRRAGRVDENLGSLGPPAHGRPPHCYQWCGHRCGEEP